MTAWRENTHANKADGRLTLRTDGHSYGHVALGSAGKGPPREVGLTPTVSTSKQLNSEYRAIYMMPRVQNQEIELYSLSIGAAEIGPTIV